MVHPKFQPVVPDFFISHYLVDRPIDWPRHFQRLAPLDVEIGFGLGDFLVRAARENPARDYVGIECDWPRVKKTLRKIERINRLSPAGSGLGNIRILQVDVQVALRRLFRERSIERMFCLFPCPWPKKRHTKHRLFAREFLRLANSRLAPGGELKIVTDHRAYRQWVAEQNVKTGLNLTVRRIRPQYDTKYERKWRQAGQRTFYEMVFTKRRHISLAVEEDAPLKRYYVQDFCGRSFRGNDRRGETTVIFKEFIVDQPGQKAMQHLVVAEKGLTQHVWVYIAAGRRGWEIAVAPGQTVLPTAGVAKALNDVYGQIVKQSSGQRSQSRSKDKKLKKK